MLQQFSGHIFVAAVIISIMLVLLVDVIKRNHLILQFYKNEAAEEIVKTDTAKTEVISPTLIQEENLAYPFYVDCSRSTDSVRVEQ